jgi:hypothetical protein
VACFRASTSTGPRSKTLFDPFLQTPAHLANDILGIGLSLVRGLVELDGGTTDSRSNHDGAVFTVVLPVPPHVPGPKVSTRPDSQGRSEWRSHRVLVVHNNFDVAHTLGALQELDGQSPSGSSTTGPFLRRVSSRRA